MKRLAAAAILLSIPFAALSDPFRPSIKDQISLGKRVKAEVIKNEKVLPPSDPRSMELDRLGQMLVRALPPDQRKSRPFEYSFQVIDSPEINAFAAPGGPIFFYTGLLDRLTTEDQVAGILAHEMIHIQNMHWASAYADNMKRRMGLALLLGLVNAGETAYTLTDLADTFFVGLPYSRRHESEADREGLKLALAARVNPIGMVEVMRTLKAASKGKVEEWMSTHPDTDRRIRDLERLVAASPGPHRTPLPRNPEVLPKTPPKDVKPQERDRPAPRG